MFGKPKIIEVTDAMKRLPGLIKAQDVDLERQCFVMETYRRIDTSFPWAVVIWVAELDMENNITSIRMVTNPNYTSVDYSQTTIATQWGAKYAGRKMIALASKVATGRYDTHNRFWKVDE